MREPLHKEGFEDFLQNQVGNHRMYPSDKLWRNIQKEIHGEGKWPALTYISIAIITALVIGTLMVKPEQRRENNSIVYPATTEEILLANTTGDAKLNTPAEPTPLQSVYTAKITQQTLQTVSEAIIAHNEVRSLAQPVTLNHQSLFFVSEKGEHSTSSNEVTAKSLQRAEENVLAASASLKEQSQLSQEKADEPIVSKQASRYFSAIGLVDPTELKKPASSNDLSYNDDIWRSYALLSAKDMLIKKLSKFSFQFYLTPSVSYRRLNDAHGKTASPFTAFPVNSNYKLDLNRMVQHSPAMGAEVGFALGYKLTNALTVKGGLQFNVRQYSIRAYTTGQTGVNGQTSPNDIATGSADEHSDNSYLATSGTGSQVVQLNNRYYELAVPVGLDWKIASSNNGRLSVNAAFSVQPTYTFDKEPFVLTTNYKSYADGASIMRNWNLNSNVEAYVSYQIGDFRWQIGPQIRYQNFSTYSNTYPIREHLLDYGVKLGFTKPLTNF